MGFIFVVNLVIYWVCSKVFCEVFVGIFRKNSFERNLFWIDVGEFIRCFNLVEFVNVLRGDDGIVKKRKIIIILLEVIVYVWLSYLYGVKWI